MTYTPGSGAADFLALTDTPGAYAGAAGLVAAVNGGETALEFIAGGGGGGGGSLAVAERRIVAVQALAGAPAPVNFEVAGLNDLGGDLTWDGGNFAWENTSGAVLEVNVVVTIACQDAGASGRPHFELQLDTGGGFAKIAGSNFWSEVGRMSVSKVWRLNMNIGDKIAVAGNTIVGSVNMIEGSSFQVHAAGGAATTLPDLTDGVEIASGRSFNGQATFFKLIALGNLPNAGISLVAHGLSGVAVTWVRIEGMADDGTNPLPLPFVTPSAVTNNVMVFLTATDIHVETGTNRSAFVGRMILEYTKT